MKSNKAFTLLEILVVVLILGILAAIAVPQYQIAVGKSKFNTIKNMTNAAAQAEEVYYLSNGKYTNNFSDLDITKPNNISCYIWNVENGQKAVACDTYINSVQTRYFHFFANQDKSLAYRNNARACTVVSVDKTNTASKICQQETGKTAQVSCFSADNYCTYYYD